MFLNLNLNEMRFTEDYDWENITFKGGNLWGLEIYNCLLNNITFEGTRLGHAVFQNVHFKYCKMSACEINGTDFEFQSPKELDNLLVGNKYPPNEPPKVQPGTKLSTPVNENGEFMTAGEARQALNHEYDIQGPEDKVPKFIIYRGPDDRPENIGD